MAFFLSKTLVLTGYGFVLSSIQVVHLASQITKRQTTWQCFNNKNMVHMEHYIDPKNYIPGNDIAFL